MKKTNRICTFLCSVFLLIILFIHKTVFADSSKTKKTPIYSYQIIKEYPHDPTAYTQGLAYADGFLFESTGLNGHSTLRKVDLYTGLLYQKVSLSNEYFGEGVTVFKNEIFQLTWQSFIGFVYEKNNFTPLKQFYYSTEGWGITNDTKNLVMSDGSSYLYIFDSKSLHQISQIQVFDENGPVRYLNELEYVKGEVYANIYPTDKIACINIESGKVNRYIDLTGILDIKYRTPQTDVLNGIAYDESKDRLFITGKKWPKLFEIKIISSFNKK